MLIKTDEFDRFLRRRDPAQFLFLFFGSDPGLVHERTRQAIRDYIGEANDPFRLVRLSGDDIATNPGLLADEAGTIGLFGDSRVIWIEAGNKSIADALDVQLQTPPASCRIIIEAGNLKPTAPLRKLLEPHKAAICVPCYADGPAELRSLIEATAKAHNLQIGATAREALMSMLGNDRLITRSELEKLCLYAHGEPEITLSHIENILNDAASSAIDDVIDSAFSGQSQQIEPLIERAFRDGIDAAYLLNASLLHALRLHRMRLEVERGGQLDTIMSRNGIHYGRKRKIMGYFPRWTGANLPQAVSGLRESLLASRLNAALSRNLSVRALWKISGLSRQTRAA